MSRRLTDADVGTAVKLLDCWTGKLTWERYLAILSTQLAGARYTKAGLRKQPRILNAWEATRKRLAEDVGAEAGAQRNGDAAVAHLRQMISRLRNEVARLRQENQDMLERFQRWSYNAATEKNMSVEQLDQHIVQGVGTLRPKLRRSGSAAGS
jgi:hypothetical protein